MTELQKNELSILRSVIGICEDLGLEYYLVCGSALGAVKYHGFIPWDDDIDIAIPRSDYEVFCEKAPEKLPESLFLQVAETDKYYPQIYCKVRDSNTTYIEKSVSQLDINHGIYIDVFPLDGYPVKKRSQKRLEYIKMIGKLMLACSFSVPSDISKSAKLFFRFERFIGVKKISNRISKSLSKYLARYSPVSSSVWCNHGNWQGELDYSPRECFGSGKRCTFEDLSVCVPELYDGYLTKKYGDWRAELPLEQQVGHHYAEVIDTTRPYSDYIVNLGKGRIRLKTSDELINDGISIPEGYRN